MSCERTKRETKAVRIVKGREKERNFNDKDLLKQLKLFNLITENMTDGLIIIRPDGSIPYMNDAANKLAYQPGSHTTYIDEDGNIITQENLPEIRILNGEKLDNYILKAVRPDKTLFLSFSGRPVYVQDKLICATICLRDITESWIALESLRKNEKLELELQNKNKNLFMSALSHELRNPIASISAGLQLIDMTNDESKLANAKEIVKRQLKQLCIIIDDMQDVTRIGLNKIKLKKELLDLNDVALVILEDIKPQFKEKGVLLNIEVGKKPVHVDADSVRLSQMIGNILQNALKFTKAGDGRVTLSVSSHNNDAVICVQDNGIGIDPAFLPDLFEPLKQAYPLNDRQRGFGLGLTIVKGMAELHGGSVRASSEGQGKGALFCIHLPLANPDKCSCKTLPGKRKANSECKVLIIDNNRDFAEILGQALEMIGYDVKLAFDGIEGLQMAADISPEVILCDIDSPGIGGRGVADKIRSDINLKKAKLIAISGFAGDDDINRALEAGFNIYCSKPVDLAKLIKMLKDI